MLPRGAVKRRVMALCVAATLGCGARTALESRLLGRDAGPVADASRGCGDDSACAPTGDPCLRAVCVAGRCTTAPVPFAQPQVYAAPGVLGHLAADGEGAVALSLERVSARENRLGLQRISLAGPQGRPLAQFTVRGDRAWDADLAESDAGFVIAGHDDGALVVRSVDRAGAVREVDRVNPTGLFVHVDRVGAGFAVTSELGQACSFLWLDGRGQVVQNRWDEAAGACAVPSLMGTTLPPFRRPVARAGNGASWWSLGGDGRITRTEARAGRVEVSLAGRLPFAMSPGPLLHRSVVAVTEGERTYAMWVRTDGPTQGAQSVRSAVMNAALEPVGAEQSNIAEGNPYPPTMDVRACHGRFVGMWYETRGGSLESLDREGRPVQGVLKFGMGVPSIPMRVVCVPGGVMVAAQNNVAVFRCGG